MAHPVPDTTLDGRPMEGTTNIEHSVLVGSLDSRLMAGMSSLEPLEQSVLNTLLVARSVEGITETDTPERSVLASQLDYGQAKLELSAWPILDITQDGNTEMDTDPSERSALAMHMDCGLLHLESLPHLMVNVALDRRPMEGITAPLPVESSGLVLAPASGHVEYSPSSRPLEHAVLIHADPAGQHAAVGMLSPSDCYPACPAGPYVAGGPVGPNVLFRVLEPLQHSVLDHADLAGQHAAVGTLSPSDCYPAGPAGPCVAGGPVGPDYCLPVMEPFDHSVPDHADPATVGPLEHSVLDMKMRNDKMDSSDESQFGSDLRQSTLELEDAIRREVLRSRSMGRVSASDVNGLTLSPEDACLCDKEISLDYQYETFNGLPVYYGGDMYDSEDSEEYDPLEMARAAYVENDNFDVPVGMELMTYTRRRPDDGEARDVNSLTCVKLCHVSCELNQMNPVIRREWTPL